MHKRINWRLLVCELRPTGCQYATRAGLSITDDRCWKIVFNNRNRVQRDNIIGSAHLKEDWKVSSYIIHQCWWTFWDNKCARLIDPWLMLCAICLRWFVVWKHYLRFVCDEIFLNLIQPFNWLAYEWNLLLNSNFYWWKMGRASRLLRSSWYELMTWETSFLISYVEKSAIEP